jgi:hypothetical protein
MPSSRLSFTGLAAFLFLEPRKLLFVDQLILDQKARRTADGYMVASPRVARTGIQDYLGSEVGRPDLKIVRVYRPENEVFSNDAMQSFGHRPVTIDHPPVLVDAKNWKKYAVGQTDGDIVRDGEFVRIPMMLMDAKAIKDVDDGKAELSMGYTAELEFTSGLTPSGEQYDAIQRNIRGNHLAIVDSARGGSKLRVIDFNSTEEADMAEKTILIDGISVSVPEQAAQIIAKYQRDADEKSKKDGGRIKELEDELAALKEKSKKEGETKDASIATLQKQLSDAQMTPAKLDEMVKSRAMVADSARKLLPSVVLDGKSESEIRRQVVDSKLGEIAKGWTDEQVAASYASFSAGANNSTTYADALKTTSPVTVADADKAYQGYLGDLSNAWKGGAK